MNAFGDVTLRVSVPDVWDTVQLRAPGNWTVARVKAEALSSALGQASIAADAYAVKYRGALVVDETQTVEALGVPDGAPLIVLRGHRRPVR